MNNLTADAELMKEFLTETTDLLSSLDNDLVSLETDPLNADLLNRIFRAVHTIKGTSSFLGFEQLVELSHAAEDVLHLTRSGERRISQEVMDILLDAVDKIKVLVGQIEKNHVQPIDLADLLDRLGKIRSGDIGGSVTVDAPHPTETDIKAKVPDTSVAANAPNSQENKEFGQDLEKSTVRVDVGRLDDLMNLVGELVLERNRLLQINREYRVRHNEHEFVDKVSETTEKIHFITNEIQSSVLKTRMVPIERLFRKYPRMIRDMARDLNKNVELIISGGETELDKTVIDQLGDPLVHLLRNSMDHGIEIPDIREKVGKKKTGTIRLSASQEGNHILVSIQDDGRGIDLERIKQKALEKGLVAPGRLAAMDRQEALALIFEPGFSTAESVSNISGRGVGMDVVRTNIRNLSGIIDIQTEINKGTEVLLKLPLTLAVIPALMVHVSKDIFAIPLASVIETLQFEDKEIVKVGKGEVIRHRDSVLPLIRLDRLFNMETNGRNHTLRYAVLVGVAEKRYGLVVDKLLGQEDIVIKALGDYLGNMPGIAGGTITGDGRVRLIVDTASVMELAA
jgi:two-component system chemotaxis sensor kinase CheA